MAKDSKTPFSNYKSAALSQLSDQRISAINRLRLDTSSLQKME